MMCLMAWFCMINFLQITLASFMGGAMMALGGVLIPGSNDGLILLGIPMLFPYALVAVSVMCATVGLAQYKRI